MHFYSLTYSLEIINNFAKNLILSFSPIGSKELEVTRHFSPNCLVNLLESEIPRYPHLNFKHQRECRVYLKVLKERDFDLYKKYFKWYRQCKNKGNN